MDLLDSYPGTDLVEWDPSGEWTDEWAAEAWTGYPLLRQAVTEDLAELDDEALTQTLMVEGFDPLILEDFMQVLGDIGRTVSGALPGIGAGAATGATVGSVVPGVGTGIGAAVGGVLGGLASVLGQLGGQQGGRQTAPRPAPRPAGTPVPARPGVQRSPSPAPPAPPPGQVARPPSTSGQDVAAQLIGVLTNPQVIQALTALLLGPNGRESIWVAGREVPVGAFVELVSEVAGEALFDPATSLATDTNFLLTEHGEALVDLTSAAERAGGLIGLLALEAVGEEAPPPGLPLLLERPPTTEELWEYVEAGEWGEADGAEAAPAFIAVAGAVISASQLGIAVFDRLQSHLLSGSFSVSSAAASYIHNPSPRGLAVQTKVFRFPITAHHPRYGIDTQTFWFQVTLEYDGFNVRRASVVEDRGRSSTLVSSSFSVTLTPAAISAPNEPVAAIVYNIAGRWDPIGRGDESFDGRFVLDAAGNLRGLRVSSPQGWVRVGRVTESGGGPVPRPTRASHAVSVFFDRPGATRLSQESIRTLHRWYQGLPEPIRAEIGAGNLAIELVGRASTTGSVQRNQQVARARAEAVAAALRDLAGSGARPSISVHGELGARTGDAQEDPQERRVDVKCEYQMYRTP